MAPIIGRIILVEPSVTRIRFINAPSRSETSPTESISLSRSGAQPFSASENGRPFCKALAQLAMAMAIGSSGFLPPLEAPSCSMSSAFISEKRLRISEAILR